MSDGRIKARVAGRTTADELFGLIDLSEHDGHGADYADALLEKLRERLPKRRVKQPEPARAEPLARLASTPMPFGQYVGQPLENCPDDYLDWLCRSQEEFLTTLRAYLRHPDRVHDGI